MTKKPCIVPKCTTGNKSNKEKCSVFQVPKDAERCKKWQAAISGVVLTQSHYVCEKHFNKKCILREWIKRDTNGRIIARSAYKRPTLDKSAVPTVFNSNQTAQCIAAHISDDGADLQMEDIVDSTTVQTVSDMVVDISNEGPSTSHAEEPETPRESVQKAVPVEKCAQSEVVEPDVTESSSQLKPHDAENVNDCAVTMTTPKANDPDLGVLNITSNDLTTEVAIKYGTHETCFVGIPKLWAVTELSTEGQKIAFSHVVTKQVNGINIPVIARSLTIQTNQRLLYCVYGHPVDAEKCTLMSFLNDPTQLPQTLERFKNMNVCNGLGAVNIQNLPANSLFQDNTQRWRHNDCPMISKRKRCQYCINMRQRIARKETKLKENRPMVRINRVSNPIDQRKLLALRKKSDRVRHLKNRAKQRCQLLRQLLSHKADQVARIRIETLEEKCSNLNLPPAQRIALSEIVSAASKRSSNSRRFINRTLRHSSNFINCCHSTVSLSLPNLATAPFLNSRRRRFS